MVDITYVITIIVYAVLAAAGYLMFGLDTMQEVSWSGKQYIQLWVTTYTVMLWNMNIDYG